MTRDFCLEAADATRTAVISGLLISELTKSVLFWPISGDDLKRAKRE